MRVNRRGAPRCGAPLLFRLDSGLLFVHILAPAIGYLAFLLACEARCHYRLRLRINGEVFPRIIDVPIFDFY